MSPASSPILSPLDITEDFVSTRSPKTAGQSLISFNGLLEPPLVLHEDLKEGCGGQLWPAGMLLSRYVLLRKNELIGKTMSVASGKCVDDGLIMVVSNLEPEVD